MTIPKPGVEEDLKAERSVISILREPLCSKINFKAHNIKISGSGYRSVAAAIEQQASNHVYVEINDAFLDLMGMGAFYSGDNSTIVISSKWMSGKTKAAIAARSTVVHEATHALLHLTRTIDTLGIEGEVVAHIAQSIYVRLSGSKMPEGSRRYAIAAELADRAIAKGAGYEFEPSELASLTNAIRAEYSDTEGVDLDEFKKSEASRTHEQVSPVGRWMVLAAIAPHPSPNNFKYKWVYEFKKGGRVLWADFYNAKKKGAGYWTMDRGNGILTTTWDRPSTTTETWGGATNDRQGEKVWTSSTMGGIANMKEGEMWLAADRL